jgi:hypothetical protein
MRPDDFRPDFSPTLRIVGLVALAALLFGVIAHSALNRSVAVAAPSPKTQAIWSQPALP